MKHHIVGNFGYSIWILLSIPFLSFWLNLLSSNLFVKIHDQAIGDGAE